MRFGDRTAILCLLCFAAMPSTLCAEPTTQIEASIGWGNRARQGVWTPIFVTVSDTKIRNAILELYDPHDSSAAMAIRMPIALNPNPQTYVLYAPMLSYGDPTKLKVIEVPSGKLLAERVVLDPYGVEGSVEGRTIFDNGTGIFIGVSGRGRAMEQLQGGSFNPIVAYLPPALLPRTPMGYDGLYLVALNQPDLSQLEVAQQAALCDWVRAGGRLVLWPGEEPIPPTSPIVQMLPCRIGDVTTISVSPEEMVKERLRGRFAKFKGRVIEPRGGAFAYRLIGDNGRVVRSRVGLGEVTVVSFEASALDFLSPGDAERFWGRIIDPAYVGGGDASFTWARAGDNSGNQIQSSRRANGAAQIVDLLGNVPGVGTFGFGYVAAVLLGMMVIVGPIDWFVLKRLGRQPWTWVTTLGWIGLVTTGALFIGYLFRSGDLHERTMRLVDQADDQVVAQLDIVGIYSPKTSDYQLETRVGSWWEPLTSNEYNYRRGAVTEIPFRQDGRSNSGNAPEEMTINVWNLRFLAGQTIASAPPVIGASLTWHAFGVPKGSAPQPEQIHIVGTVTNLTDAPLTGLWLHSRYGVYELSGQSGFSSGGLAPHASFSIDVVQTRNDLWTRSNMPANQYVYSRYGRPHLPVDAMKPFDVVRAASELSPRQSRQIEAIVGDSLSGEGARPDAAAIYAIGETPVAAAKLVDQKPIEKHWQVLRALVPVARVKE